MILTDYTTDELRTQLASVRNAESQLNETAAGWCQRGIRLTDPAYISLKAAAADLKAIGDELHAEITGRRRAEDTAQDGDRVNPYDMACDRFERISRLAPEIHKQAKAIAQWAEDEYEAATADLRQYERSPGIPRPEYRPDAVDRALARAVAAGHDDV